MFQADGLLGSQGGQSAYVFQVPETLEESNQKESYEDPGPMKWWEQADTGGFYCPRLHSRPEAGPIQVWVGLYSWDLGKSGA